MTFTHFHVFFVNSLLETYAFDKCLQANFKIEFFDNSLEFSSIEIQVKVEIGEVIQ